MLELFCGVPDLACPMTPVPFWSIVVMLMLIVIGAATGLLNKDITPNGACIAVKVLVQMAVGAMLVWHWMFEQDSLLWTLQRLSLVLGLLVSAVAWPLALSIAVFASVRDGREILRGVQRVLLTFAVIPLVYVLVYQTGWWPSQISEHAMTATFFRNKPAFDRIAAQIDARSDEECRHGCPVPTDPDAPVGRGYELAEMFLYPYWRIGWYRDAMVKGYVYAPKHLPVPLVDNFDASTSNGSQYTRLSGNWYLYAED